MDTYYIGIDPGKSGAIAFIPDKKNFIYDEIKVFDFSDNNGFLFLKEISLLKRFAVLEKVNAMPGQGVSSTFKFGTNFGTWIGRLEMAEISFDYITPRKWQKEIYDSMPTKGVDKKELSLDRARRLFPEMVNQIKRKKDHGRSDALLIAEYCKRIKTN